MSFARSELKSVSTRPHLSATGVYILEGSSDVDSFARRIYVGESDNCLKRLRGHTGSETKDFWTRTIVFTSKDDNLNKAHARYLEARMIQLATDAKRASVANSTAPPLPPLSEADTAEAEGFLREMLLILPVLGVDAFERAEDIAASSPPGDQPMLFLSGKDAEGRGQDRPEGFLVFAGSLARPDEVPSIHAWGTRMRKTLIESGVLIPADGGFQLVKDYVFDSPSQAAMVLLGRSANGRIEWKTAEGLTLKEIQTASEAE